MTLQVFVSYKSEYRDFARKVRDQLRGWGYETWFDIDNIPKGAYFRHAIQEGLDTSDVLVSVITPEAQSSREVMAEVDYFLSQNKPLVPLKRGDFKLLYIFITIQYIDFTRDEAEAFADLHKRLAELAAVESPSPPPAEEASYEPEPADGKKADGLPLPAAPPAANQPQRQPIQAPQQQPTYHEPVKRKATFIRYLLPAAAAIALVSVGVLALVSGFGSPNISMTESPQFQWWIPLLAVAVAGGLALWWRWGRRTSSIEQTALDENNRARMLDKVYDFWVVGVLENALQESGAFEVGLAAVPGAVLRHKDYGDYPLPPNAKIIDIFNDLNRELLILGAPGAGKTILLLQLAKALIEAARGQALTPSLSSSEQGRNAIPVVFNLSSWAVERKPLNEWIVDELQLRYQVPEKAAETWIAEQSLVLLLDGLDEVDDKQRRECVEAINAFREQYPIVDIAVCSRIADYEMLTRKLDLRGAVALQPLTDEQIVTYLNRPELDGLRQIMNVDSAFLEMATTPFLLNAMAYAYRGIGIDVLRALPDETTEARRKRLLDAWVERRLAGQYKVEHVRHYLSWLADKMLKLKQTVFYIEEMQPEFIENITQRTRYGFISGLASGFITGIQIGTVSGFILTILFPSQPTGLIAFIVFVLGISFMRGILSRNDPKWRWNAHREKIYMAYSLTWSRDNMRWAWQGEAYGTKYFGCGAIGLIIALIFTVGSLFRISLTPFIITAILIVLIIVSIMMLSMGISPSVRPDVHIRFRQIILRSILNAIGIGVAVGLWISSLTVIGLLVWNESYRYVANQSLYIVFAFLFGTSVGSEQAWIKPPLYHIVLNYLLHRANHIPRDYPRFLDTCAKIGVLRKIGGGYIFAHRYLLEYFAGLEVSAGK